MTPPQSAFGASPPGGLRPQTGGAGSAVAAGLTPRLASGAVMEI